MQITMSAVREWAAAQGADVLKVLYHVLDELLLVRLYFLPFTCTLHSDF